MHFRRVHGLKAYPVQKGGRHKWYDWSRAFKLHAEGYTDREIGIELDRDQQTVQKWRRKSGLKANYAKPGWEAAS